MLPQVRVITQKCHESRAPRTAPFISKAGTAASHFVVQGTAAIERRGVLLAAAGGLALAASYSACRLLLLGEGDLALELKSKSA